jgi:radical SAM superfamily enzyme YgiQ (UPF0313 family)
LRGSAKDKWSTRAYRNINTNLCDLRNGPLYTSPDRYARAVSDLSRVLEKLDTPGVSITLANYQDADLSPLNSQDLIQAATRYQNNIFYPYFSKRLPTLLEQVTPSFVGFSLNYLSQALTTFAMIGFLKQIAPDLPIILGGGLVTSWLRNPSWKDPFTGLVDLLVAGPGEKPLLKLFESKTVFHHHAPSYEGLPVDKYLSPGLILPYAASSGCYWNRCSFCPEKAEDNPYQTLPVELVRQDLLELSARHAPSMVHFLDNAISPTLMKSLVTTPLNTPWYGFARINRLLSDLDFCKMLHSSGCVMLKLGVESGDQGVLDEMDKGIDIPTVSQVLHNLRQAGIATYVYLLFGTPSESLPEARRTMDFVIQHHNAISFMNLAIFNMPACSAETHIHSTTKFYEADLGLYTDFEHPRGWNRALIRRFLEQEFKRHPAIKPIILRDPPVFTSNHAPFFKLAAKGSCAKPLL